MAGEFKTTAKKKTALKKGSILATCSYKFQLLCGVFHCAVILATSCASLCLPHKYISVIVSQRILISR